VETSVSALTQHRIKSFQEFRSGLLDLKKADLSHQVLSTYRESNLQKLAGIAGGTHNQIGYLLGSLGGINDVDVLDVARDDLVKIIDDCLVGFSGQAERVNDYETVAAYI
jgi:CHAD domain-containing protein